MSRETAAKLRRNEEEHLVAKMLRYCPHTVALGMRLESIADEVLTLCLPYREELRAGTEVDLVHSSALTALLDHTLGLSNIASSLIEPYLTITLDLKIDHLREASAGKDILASAKVIRATDRVLFSEGVAYVDSQNKPVARATASFMLMPHLKLKELSDELWLKA